MSLFLLAVNLSANDFNIILNFIVNNNPEVQQKFNLLRSLDIDVGYGSERDSSMGGFYFGTTVDIKEYWDFKEKLRDKEKQIRLEVIDLIDGLLIAKADALLLKMQKNYFSWFRLVKKCKRTIYPGKKRELKKALTTAKTI